ncbi:MAG TPA: response regulator transcription factor [Devosia sp.]|nr:response regulator transcription factor [Devosia sp.]
MLNKVNSSTAIVVDSMHLRGAGVVALISPWAHSLGIEVLATTPGSLSMDLEAVGPPRFVIFSVGGMSLHGAEPARWAEEVTGLLPGIPCLVLSDRQEPEEAILAARLGVQAFLSTNVEPSMALQALAFVISGGTYFPREALLQSMSGSRGDLRVQIRVTSDASHLTRRQNEVLERLRLGRSNKHIGRDLDMQESTVKVHVRQIMRKLGAANRTQAALLASGVNQVAGIPPAPSDLGTYQPS